MGSLDNLKRGNKATQFSSDRQPKPELISLGHKRKKLLKTISQQLVEGESKEALKSLAEYLGVNIEEIDLETAMHIKQMEKAIKDGDTRAYIAVMDRIEGKPQQKIDHTTQGQPINEKPLTEQEIKNIKSRLNDKL